MRLHSFRSSYSVIVLFGILLLSRTKLGICNPITNSNLNEHIREFASKEDNINATNVKTLQKEDSKRYTDIVPYRSVHFKDIPDNKLSGSSNGRGLVSREYPGYALHDYEEYPHVNYGYDYHLTDTHHHGYDHPDFNHQYGHHEGHYLGHHKHYNHALAAKAVLWPIAGIALLGAAAALVSNPILLQLGVASGKRRRRNTEEIFEPDLTAEISKWSQQKKQHVATIKIAPTNLKSTKTKHLLIEKINDYDSQRNNYKKKPTTPPYVDYNEGSDEIKFIPVPIKTI